MERQLNVPPHSIEAEQGVIGGLLLDNKAWDLVADKVHPEDFYRNDHRQIFEAILELADRSEPFDIVTVSEVLEGKSGWGGLAYVVELAKNTPSVANIVHYAKIVSERAHLRRLISIGFEMSRQAYEPGADVALVHEEAERALFGLSQDERDQDFADMGEVLGAVIDEIDRNFNSESEVTGVPTGLPDLDAMTGGLQPADLVIVAARPSMGKTSLVMNWVKPILDASPGKSIQIYSMEMPARQLQFRFLSQLGRLDLQALLRGKLQDEDWPKLQAAVAVFNKMMDRLAVDDSANLTPTSLRAKARRGARKYGPPAAIMLDYLQLMRCPGYEGNRTLEVGEISRALKGLAKEFNCPVIALSQLSRDCEKRPNKRPVNADLRESGAIEQDADIIMFVYRDEVYNPDTEYKGVAELILGKQRNGAIGTVRTAFIGKETRFAPLTADSFRSLD
ncbi:replicative DNA helicase [Pseudomonas nitroreducens]|uniref:replicative DNA helicase n=1 Tax=Pseudomonas nitroreducens TaxID=46680 RepID=UPI002657C9C7|nr:replicative DNA helicase [Pseudomonas nitroreducens]MCP1652308.1 replicative DNA helicase [Pseudomonas nitroreducens]MCP1689818.1 replicative DNA helicase [Pseudomonas nitroreducens]